MDSFFGAARRSAVLTLVVATVSGCSWVGLPRSENTPPNASAVRPAQVVRPDADGLATVRSRVAFNALKNKDFNAAERLFRQAHEDDPNASQPLAGLGLALYAQGRFADAATAYRDALTREPDHSGAQDGLAKSLISLGKYGEARNLLETLAQSAPNASVLNKLGVARDLSGDGEGAQRAYRAALDLEPKNLSARNNLALSLAVSGKYAEAIAEMQSVTVDPRANTRHRGNLAFIHGLAGDLAAVERVSGEAGGPAERNRRRAHFDRVRSLATAGERARVLDMLARGEDGTGEGPESSSLKNFSVAVNNIENKGKTLPDSVPSEGAAETAQPPVAASSPGPKDAAGAVVAAVPSDNVATAGDKAAATPGHGTAAIPDQGSFNILENSDKASIENNLAEGETTGTAPAESRPMPSGEPQNADMRRTVAAIATPRAVVPRSMSSGETKPDPSAMATGGAWRVQLAAYRTLASTDRGRRILMRDAGDLLPGLDALMRRSARKPLGSADFRLRTPVMADRGAAEALCKALTARAGPCLAVRQPDGMWAHTNVGGAADRAGRGAAGGWRVQLAAYRSLAHAERGHTILMRKVGDLLPGLEGLRVAGSDRAGTPENDFRLRTPAMSDRAAASTLCNALQGRGISCLVIRHADGIWRPAP